MMSKPLYQLEEKKDLGKSTLCYRLSVNKATIVEFHQAVFNELVKNLQVKGFRRGAVPPDIAKKHIKEDILFKKLAQKVIEELWQALLKDMGIKPLVNPKIELVSAKQGEDWVVAITVATKPAVDVSDYKKMLTDSAGEAKKEAIWVPGKSEAKTDEKEPEKQKQLMLNKILNKLLTELKVDISDLIIELEVNKRLAKLVDDVRRVGLTTEQYLQSKGESLESLKAKYNREVEDMYKLEFILEAIADEAKITVEEADLAKIFAGIKDEAERSKARANAYFYASLVRRQKTLDHLVEAS